MAAGYDDSEEAENCSAGTQPRLQQFAIESTRHWPGKAFRRRGGARGKSPATLSWHR